MSSTLGLSLNDIEAMDFDELLAWHAEARRVREAAPGCALLMRTKGGR